MKQIIAPDGKKIATLTAVNAVRAKDAQPARRIWRAETLVKCLTCGTMIPDRALFSLKRGDAPECTQCYPIHIIKVNSAAYPESAAYSSIKNHPDGFLIAIEADLP